MAAADLNGDGVVSVSEFIHICLTNEAAFFAADTDGDQTLSREELWVLLKVHYDGKPKGSHSPIRRRDSSGSGTSTNNKEKNTSLRKEKENQQTQSNGTTNGHSSNGGSAAHVAAAAARPASPSPSPSPSPPSPLGILTEEEVNEIFDNLDVEKKGAISWACFKEHLAKQAVVASNVVI